MSFLSKLFPQPFEGPNDNSGYEIASPWSGGDLARVTWADLIGDQHRIPVGRNQILSLAAYSRGRDIIVNTLGRISLVAADDNGVEKTGSNSAFFAAQPDPNFSRYVTIMWTVDDLLFYGVAWWLVTSRYSLDNRPKTISRVLPGTLAFDSNGSATIDSQPVNASDLIRFDGPNDGLLARAGTSVRQALDLEEAASKFAAVPTPTILLQSTDDTNLTPEAAKDLTDAWANRRHGPNGSVGYAPANLKVSVLGAPLENLLIQGRQQQAVDAARFLGIPADMLEASTGNTGIITYANISQRAQALIDFGIAPFGAAIENRLTMADITPSGTFIKFKYGELTEASDANPDTPQPEPATTETQQS